MSDSGLQALLDKQAIHEVLMCYCRGIDRCDEELLRSVYHDDAWDEHGEFKGPASEFVPWVLKGLRSGRFLANYHSISNVLIELDGDVARSEAYVTSWHPMIRDGAHENWIFAGRYVDRFERRDGVWKIARRITVLDWQTTIAGTDFPGADASLFTRGRRDRSDPVFAR
jgi:hypothetical protein